MEKKEEEITEIIIGQANVEMLKSLDNQRQLLINGIYNQYNVTGNFVLTPDCARLVKREVSGGKD